VNLAELSLSGSLMPSVPTQLMLKYDPPKITIVYHFEQRENERFYHEIMVERRMLETLSDDDITSHLYVTEAYYFNPKQIKRQQVRWQALKLLITLDYATRVKTQRRVEIKDSSQQWQVAGAGGARAEA
jgi:hypothetical protein